MTITAAVDRGGFIGEGSADDGATCPPLLDSVSGPTTPARLFDPGSFDLLPLPTYVCDATGFVMYANPAAAALWGIGSFSKTSRVRYVPGVLYTADGVPLSPEACWVAECLRENRELSNVEFMLERACGTRRRVLGHAKPLRNAQGLLCGAVVMLDDVTQPLAAEVGQTLPLADLNDYVLRYDLQWRLTHVGDEVLAVLGSTREALLGRRIWEVFPVVERNGYMTYLYRAVAERRSVHFEHYSPLFDGWFANHVYPLTDGVLVLGELVTERKRREQNQNALLELIPVATYWCDAPSGTLRYYNRHAAELWGYSPDLVNHPPRYCGAVRCYTAEGVPLEREQLPHVSLLSDGVPIRNAELIYERPDGSRITVLGTAEAIRNEEGQVIGALTVVQDITARKQAEEIRSHLAAIVESSHDAIITRDFAGNITFWNAAAERLYGYRADEMVGRPVRLLYPPDRADEEIQLLPRILEGERIEHFETVRLHKNGWPIEVSITISPVRDRQGCVIGASHVAHSIEERKRHERALSESEERYRCLVEASGGIVITADTEARWLSPVPAWESYTGQSFTEYRHHGWLAAVHPDDRAAVRALMQESLWTGDMFQLEVRVWHQASQSYRYQETRAVPILSPNGQVREWVGTVTDIHARKLAEEQVRQADRRKDEFLAVLAHELRNPLAPVVTSLHILRMPGAEAMHADALAIMDRQLHHLVRLVDDLMEVARITSGTIELRKELLRLDEVIMAAVEISRPGIESRSHELATSLPQVSLRVNADRVRLTQIIANLLNNAARYTPVGGQIRIEVTPQQGEVAVSIIDNGVGIEQEQQERIFEMFTRAQPQSVQLSGGLGIGLGLARRLAQLHGGRVEAYSTGKGQGSRFTLWLPLALALEAPAPSGNVLRRPLKRRRVLVLDDNQDAAATLATLLVTLGQDVKVVHDGAAALAMAEIFQPELALLDLGMPPPDGFSVARALRLAPWAEGLALVAVTGWGQDVDRQRSQAAGFDLHLVKPVSLDDLQVALSLKTDLK